jgi:nucleotide-binding universal stress UspA family protein
MYHVLAAHDLSGRSEVALARAGRLALEREGELTIIHVIDRDLPQPIVEAERKHIESYLQTSVRQQIGREKPPYRITVIPGDPAETIAVQSEALSVDLVVTGRHRQRTLKDMFVGTTVERLLRQTRRPVLVVNNRNFPPYRNILIPVDFSEASKAAIQHAAANFPKATLQLLHTFKGPFQDYVATLALAFSREERAKFAGPLGEQAKQAMSRMIETMDLGTRAPQVTIKNGEPVPLIEEELAAEKTDLVVIGTHARSGIALALMRSVADAVLKTAACDVLVIPVAATN